MNMKHENDNDHEIWIRCFTAAIGGPLSHGAGDHHPRPMDVMAYCAQMADAALVEERQRRREATYLPPGAKS